jgi:uracil-DNA glycosylase family 4
MKSNYDPNCKKCPRLVHFLANVKKQYPDYFCRPVSSFGEHNGKLLIVGLAPGMHGANRTGRPFTGDYAGVLLYETLYKFGFSNKKISAGKSDGLKLINCAITNAVKCLPPNNKPIANEINQCNYYLINELLDLPPHSAILALGGVAHKAIIKAMGLQQSKYKFCHSAEYLVQQKMLFNSYHCSRYNTNTKRLTKTMFQQIFVKIHRYLDNG